MESICLNFGDYRCRKRHYLNRRMHHASCLAVLAQPSRKDSSAVASDMRKRGRNPIKKNQVKEAMKRDIQAGTFTDASLRAMLEKTLADKYGVSRDTARKARDAVLSEIVENSNRDK